MAVRPHSNSAHEISTFIDAVEQFARELPAGVQCTFTRQGDEFQLSIEPPTPDHRELHLGGDPVELEYSLGKVWTEGLDPTTIDLTQLFAALDAVRAGKVKEARDRRTGVTYHVYQLRTRGLHAYLQDGQYSLWNWLRLKVRAVEIHSLPALAAGKR